MKNGHHPPSDGLVVSSIMKKLALAQDLTEPPLQFEMGEIA
jgi:hypothetical protein